MSTEEAKTKLLKAQPDPAKLRWISACIPFTCGEWDKIRAGHWPESMDDKWILFTEGTHLYIFRSAVNAVWFSWKVCFTPQNNNFLLTEIITSEENTKGEMFQDDAHQIGSVWYLIEMILLGRNPARLETFYELAAKFRKAQLPPGQLLQYKESVLSAMSENKSEGSQPIKKDETPDLQHELNNFLLLTLAGLTRPFLLNQLVTKIQQEISQHGGFIHEIAVRMGIVNREEMLNFLSKEWEIPVAVLENGIDEAWSTKYLKQFAKKHLLIALYSDEQNKTVTLAMSHPLNMLVREEIYLRTGFEIRPYLALPSEIALPVNRLFPDS